MNEYIQPNIVECDNLIELKQDHHYFWRDKTVEFNDIFEYKRCFVFAEPGYGKTTLLRNLYNKAVFEGYQCLYIDLKKISRIDSDALLDMILNLGKDEIFNEYGIEKTFDVKLDTSINQIICLDALDEVKISELDVVYKNIQCIAEMFDQATVIVSARVNRSEKYTELTKRVKFKYLKILKFDRAQLNEFLYKNLNNIGKIIEKHNKDKIIKNIQDVDSEILLIPRYLSYILRLIKIDLDFFKKKINRSDIMERVLLEKVGSQVDEYEERMQLRVFGKLALAMEIHQTKEITIDDFIAFFELINSKVCERTYFRNSVKEIYSNTVLKYSHGMIGFENAEIQEYLAAREISLLNDSDKRLYDIVTDNPASIIFPYWKNTMSYYVEVNPHSLHNILKYDYRTDVDHQSNVTEILSFIDISEYTKEEQLEIAKLIYQHFQSIGHWIPYTVEKQVSKMLPMDYLLRELLNYKKNPKAITHFLIGNQLKLILSKVELVLPSDSVVNKLRQLLIGLIEYNNSSVVQRYSLGILSVIGQRADVEGVYKYLRLEDESTERELINICSDKFYNSSFAVKLFYGEFTSRKVRLNNVYSGIMNISKSEYFVSLLEYLIQDRTALNNLLDYSSRDYHGSMTGSAIRKPSKKLLLLIEQVIEMIITNPNSYHYSEKSDFFGELIKLFDKKNPMNSLNLFHKWINNEEDSCSRGYIRYYHDRFLFRVLSVHNSKVVFDYLNSLEKESRELELFAVSLYWRDKEKYNSYLGEIEKKVGRNIIIETVKKDADEEIYKEFSSLLHVIDIQYRTDVFSFFSKNTKVILDKATPEEINDLKTLSERIVENTSFDNVSIKQGKFEKQYTITETMVYFCYVLETLYLLEYDLNNYRDKILSLIPYMDLYSGLEFIKKLLGELSSAEIEKMISKWRQIDDNAFKFHGVSVLRFIKQLGVQTVSVYQFILDLYEEYNYESHEIIEFIEILDEFGIDDEYLKAQLKIHEQNPNVVMCINSILIERGDHTAINWRFEKIKQLAQKFKKPEGIHSVSSFENETMSLRIAEPIMLLPVSFENRFIELVEFSLLKYQEDDDFYEYASYLWKVVKGFYKKRIEVDPMLDLRKLQSFSNRSKEEKGISLFLYTLNEIIDYHLTEHSKRFKFQDSILFLNKISSRKKIIDNSRDFNRMLQQIIENDLKRWVEYEGAYKMMAKMDGQLEDLFQKTIKGQIELACIKRGFNVKVLREPQSLSDKRPDFFISYGFAGTQLIEVKRLGNSQVRNIKEAKGYKEKLKSYVEAHNADNIIYLIIRLNETSKNLDDKIKELQNMYKDDNRIVVCGLDGLAGNNCL